ncbi:DUF309 domain-containing protein [Halobacillus seohaensis]|uniref:DUF309 domain-containing protein n=1 Tax=Halobacillus seohaensis TaxID=447421 RepID=A0ABW2EHP9_9BACI
MYPQHYIEFLAHFHGTRDYFECHEVLEHHWKETEPGYRDSVWVLLIQFAVSLYHLRRGNRKGASILINKTIQKLSKNKENLLELGIDYHRFENLVISTKTGIDSGDLYKSENIPVNDTNLLKEVKQLCKEWGVSYGDSSNLLKKDIIDKHKRRRV